MDICPCPLCGNPLPRLFATVEDMAYYQCPQCALIFLAPHLRLPEHDEKKRYELHQNSPDDPAYRDFLSPLVAELATRIPEGAYGLDFGAGPGPAIPAMFQQLGFEVNIYDPYFAPDRGALKNQYDFISCSETIEHIFNPTRELALLRSILKPEGWLGIQTQFFDEPETFASSHYRRDPTHVCFYSRPTFEFIAQKYAWKPEFPRKNICMLQKIDS